MKQKITDTDRKFMKQATDLAVQNVEHGGGPFGAVIVKDGEIIATGANSVVPDNDPTAHAEVNAIRNACSKVHNFKLDGCVIYSSCEPCPMCLSALYWAGVSKIYFGNTKEDAMRIDFDDKFIYDELEKPIEKRNLPCIHMEDTDAMRAFNIWKEKEDKVEY